MVFIYLYSTNKLLGSPVDGNMTLGENLADHGGLKMALEAYKQWKEEYRDHRLPALPYTDMQLFFIGSLKHCLISSSLNLRHS